MPMYRPYPPPFSAPWVMTQTWRNLLLAHWPADENQVRAALPAALPLDTFDGQAWISIVAFGITDFRLRWLPPLPLTSTLLEVNVRTYVTIDGKPGIYASSLDADNRLVVWMARRFYHLNYFTAGIRFEGTEEQFVFESTRRRSAPEAGLDMQWSVSGEPKPPEPGSLTYWLTERYCIYSVDQRQRVYRTEADHPDWLLQDAEGQMDEATLVTAQGLPLPEQSPLTQFCRELPVLFWLPARID